MYSQNNKKMKTNYFISIILSIFLFSCNNNETISEIQKESLEDKVGFYHNQALSLYYESDANINSTDYDEVKADIINVLTNSENSTFNESEIKQLEAKASIITIKSNIKFRAKSESTTSKDVITNDFKSIITYLKDNNEISDLLFSKLSEINVHVILGDLSSEQLLNSINSLSNFQWSENDQKYITTFVQVYNSSYSFWKTESNKIKALNGINRVNQSTMKEGDAVIIADAAGAIYGMLLGPVWSIVEGAIFSVIANNQ